MIEKIIIKFIYFLLKFVKSDIASINLFMEDCAKIAKGEFHTVNVEMGKYRSDSKRYIKFTAYIAGYEHKSGSTPKEALDKFNPSETITEKVTKVLD